MRLKPVPANTLAAVAALLGPYVDPGVSPQDIVAAIKSHDAKPAADPAARRVLSLKEAGKALGLSWWTVRRMAVDGRIGAVRIGVQWKVPLSEIEAKASIPANTQPISEEG